MTPSKQALDPLTLAQLDALEARNTGIKFRAFGRGAASDIALRLIAMARQSIILLNAPKPMVLSDNTIEAETTARFGNHILASDMGAYWCRDRRTFKQGAEFARQYIAQPGAEDEG